MPDLELENNPKTIFVFDPVKELFESINKTIPIISVATKNQLVSSKFIYTFTFNVKRLYSSWIFRSPNPTLRPVKVSAHITPATVKISFAMTNFNELQVITFY